MTIRPAPQGSVLNAMTVDVEDYFHVSAFDGVVPRSQWQSLDSRVEANTERLLAIFDAAEIRATFFVLGLVAEKFPDLVRRIAQRHEVASHGYAHHLVYKQSLGEFREDVRRSKGLLEAITGTPVFGYRAPSFSITRESLWAIDVLVDEGFRYDASIFPIYHDRYGIPEAPRRPFVIDRPGGSIIEMPGSTVRCGPMNLPVGGGGYFRILPYSWTRWGIARLNKKEGVPAIFYLHPWEIDSGQPRLPAGRLSRFRHYTNLEKTEASLRTLLKDFRFGPVQALLGDVRTIPIAPIFAQPVSRPQGY
jgi:polysaccharide deacetylase family protein (PEP-CTERM system associated)